MSEIYAAKLFFCRCMAYRRVADKYGQLIYSFRFFRLKIPDKMDILSRQSQYFCIPFQNKHLFRRMKICSRRHIWSLKQNVYICGK